jgi:hypothetical protein
MHFVGLFLWYGFLVLVCVALTVLVVWRWAEAFPRFGRWAERRLGWVLAAVQLAKKTRLERKAGKGTSC